MTHRLSLDQLQQLESIMQKMLIEANAANWPELSRLDGERRILLNYPENARELRAAAMATPAISSGQRPVPLTPSAIQTNNGSLSGSSSQDDDGEQDARTLEACRRLSKELLELDATIKKTIESAKEALLKESRGMRAQVSAKKGYEQANNMTPRSYS